MYAEMFDGLRSHYEKRLRTKGSAGFQAAMSFSALFGFSAAAVFIITNALLTGDLHGLIWLYDHKVLVLGFGVIAAWAHVQYAKYKNVYERVGPPMSSSWRHWFVGYCIVAASLSLVALWTAYAVGPYN